MSTPGASVTQSATRPIASDGRERILVVEADAGFGEALVEQLVADGHPAELARTAAHAEMLASARLPRLVALGELDSPRGALDLLEAIRGQHPQSPDRHRTATWQQNLPVIVLSSRTTEPDMLRAFEAGADDFLVRPLQYLELRGLDFNSGGPSDFNS